MPIQLYTESYELLYVMNVVMAGALTIPLVARFFKVSISYAAVLYVWHSLFAVAYAMFVVANGGDAREYYLHSFNEPSFSLGTHAVRVGVSFLSVGLGYPFLACSLTFAFLGYLGVVAFYSSLKEVMATEGGWWSWFIAMIPLLPSLNFWSVGLGKDSVSFFSICMILWVSFNLNKRWGYAIVPFLLLFIVRPHIAGMVGAAFAVSFLFRRGITWPQRVIIGGLALLVSAFLVPLALDYSGVEGGRLSDVSDFIEGREGANLKGGGAVDISNMSLPEKMFTYLFRPTLIEARNLFFLAAALDNTILLFLFVAGTWALIKKPLPPYLRAHNRMFLWIYSLCAWLILAMTTANLGIALRQKWMFAPMLIFLLISVIGRSRYPAESDAPAIEGSNR
ncbi:hypothetical protein [Alcanivorax sediminis]|uniref:Uncharacterized protein n=1 Tax=Alcanivorax sediminis TaxID=2663008 RepID=A0A6N7M1L4_9GAMM|nr:hypothetical protein [Alcanivorax sediminis]MQX54381.1 hypothetical protein [Alcanivorax sediminis]